MITKKRWCLVFYEPSMSTKWGPDVIHHDGWVIRNSGQSNWLKDSTFPTKALAMKKIKELTAGGLDGTLFPLEITVR